MREAAVKAIAREGRSAEGPVRRRMETEKDIEARARLGLVLDRIAMYELGARRWQADWEKAPLTAGPVAMALSIDGRLAATLGEDSNILLIETATRQAIHTIEVHPDTRIRQLAFNAAGSVLLGLDYGGTKSPRAWRTSDGRSLRLERGKPLPNGIETWLGQSDLVLCWRRESTDRSLLIWVADPSGVVDVACNEHLEAISEDGRRIAFARSDRDPERPDTKEITLSVYDTSTRKRIRRIRLTTAGNLFPGNLSPDASAVAIVDSGRVRVRSLDKKRPEITFGTGAVNLAWSGSEIISSHNDGAIRWWRAGVMVREVKDALDNLRWVSVSDGVVRASGRFVDEREREVDRYAFLSAATGELLTRQHDVHFGGVSRFRWFKNSLRRGFVVFSREKTCVFHAGRLVSTRPFVEYFDDPWWNPTVFGGDAAVVRQDECAVLHDLAAGDATAELPRQGARILRLEWTRDGLIAYSEARAALIDTADGRVLKKDADEQFATVSGRFLDLTPLEIDGGRWYAVSADGAWVAVRSETGVVVRRADGSGEKRLLSIEDGPEASAWEAWGPFVFSADGSLLAAASGRQGCIAVWETATGREAARIGPFDHSIDRVAIEGKQRMILVTLDAEKDSLLRFSSDGTPLGKVDWPSRGYMENLVVQGRFALAHAYGGKGPPALFVLDLQEPGAPQGYPVPELEGTVINRIHEAPDGERLIVEGCGEVLAFSCRTGFLRSLGSVAADSDGIAGFLEGGHAVVLTQAGLTLLYGPTWEELARDPAIHGQALAVSPDGRLIAVACGTRVTIYSPR
ncbi:MAG: hypothetical protein HYY18_13005 [Planctomycetes bacterium]|nr:hypothetical protein [Planctomycetota bacterium]